ncbi:MAG: PKD domain-containing protein [Thermoanaerobaculia bacterium]|nr:PKD domain-containing protein [Thermoanaerobaculia bacterium]
MVGTLLAAKGQRLVGNCVTAVALFLLLSRGQSAEAQCALSGSPVSFEPRPPGVSRPITLSSGFSSNLALYKNGGSGPFRLLMQESYGYSVLDLTNPVNPTALFYHDVRFPLGGPNSVNHGGDGQNNIQTIAVSPDGQRVAFSMTGPTSFHTVVGSPNGAGFTLWGDFRPDRASGTLIQHIGSRYIAYNFELSVTAADITTLPTGSLQLDNFPGGTETSTLPGGVSPYLAGNRILYRSGAGIEVVDASNPGPIGRITSGYPRTTITSADFGGRTIAAYSAAVDPADATKVWVLAELNAQAGENSPSYGLLHVTSGLAKVSAGPIWRVPSQAGEVWWSNPGASSALVAGNSGLFVLMWAQRATPSLLFKLYSTTTFAWSAVNSSAPPGAFDIPTNIYSNFSPGQPMRGFAAAPPSNSLYAYLPTGSSAYVIPMSCVSVNAPAAAIVGPLFVNDVTPVKSCEEGTLAECTVFLGDRVSGTLAVLPPPVLQPVTGWNFDFDFHAGVSSEDSGGSAFPRLRAPDNGAFGNPSAPPGSFTLVGPCDPNVGGASPSSGAGCWASVTANAAFAGGAPDFTGAEAAGSARQLSLAFEADNRYGSAGATIASLRWQVPAIRLGTPQILTGSPVDATGSDGQPAAAGFSWYFGSNTAAPAGEILTRDPGCGGPACPHAFPGNGTRNFNVWVKVPYANGYVSPDCPGMPASCQPTALQPALKIQVADIQPAFLVNGASVGPVMVVTSNPTIAITNQSNPGSFSPQYFYGLCPDATGVSSACQPTASLPFTGGAGTIPTPQTGGAWFLRIRATYGAGLFVDWLSGSPASTVFPVNVTVVSPLVVGVTANPAAAYTNQLFVFSCNVSGGLPPYSYEWRSPLQFVVGTSPTFQTSSSVAGSVQAWCFVADAAGTQSSDSASVPITAAPPVMVTVTASANPVVVGSTVSFTCNAAGGTGAGFSYSWSGNAVSGTGPTASQTFGAAGNYVATCTAADLGSGAFTMNSTTVTVTPPPVQASGAVSPPWVYPGNPATFSCTATGGTGPYTYTWTFTGGGTSSAQNPAHAFAAPGSASGTCTARDTIGTTGSVALSVTVIPAGGSGPTAFFGLSPCRLLDTRNAAGPRGGPSIGPSGGPDRVFLLTGTCGIPANARSLVTNVTVTNAGAVGDLSVFGANDSPGGTTSVSFRAGVARANANVVRLATDGSGTIRVRNNSAAPLDLILDVSGYFR